MPHKPFPWYCSRCKTATVELRDQKYEFVQSHDGRKIPIIIDDIPIPTCTSCDHKTLAASTLEQITLETYRQLGLLTPQEIRENRERLGLTQQQMQTQLGLGGNTLSRWEKGHFYQSKAHDRFMRVFFSFEQVRTILATSEPPPLKTDDAPLDNRRFPRLASGTQPRKHTKRPSLWAA